MYKKINQKPIRKVRRVNAVVYSDKSKRIVLKEDVDDFIFGDERSVHSNR